MNTLGDIMFRSVSSLFSSTSGSGNPPNTAEDIDNNDHHDWETLSDEHAAACAGDSQTDSETAIGNIDGIDNVRSRSRHEIFLGDNLGSPEQSKIVVSRQDLVESQNSQHKPEQRNRSLQQGWPHVNSKENGYTAKNTGVRSRNGMNSNYRQSRSASEPRVHLDLDPDSSGENDRDETCFMRRYDQNPYRVSHQVELQPAGINNQRKRGDNRSSNFPWNRVGRDTDLDNEGDRRRSNADRIGYGHELGGSQGTPVSNVSGRQDPDQTTRPVRRKEREPDKFDDKTWDWDDYVAHFMSVARWNRWTEDEMAAQLAMSLRGSARTILGNMSEQEICNFQLLKAALTRRYSPNERLSAYRNEFRNRKRVKTENLVEYACALRRLSTKAHPNLSPSNRETLIVDQFIFGLSHLPDIKKHVQFGHPKTLDDAIDLGVEYETFEAGQTVRKPPATVAGVTSDQNDPLSKYGSRIQSEISELVKLSKANANALANLTKAVQDSQSNQINSPKKFQKGTDWKRKACYLCHEVGHYQDKCPQKSGDTDLKQPNQTGQLNMKGLSLGPKAQP